MTNRLIKTKKDHKRLRAVLAENTVTQTMTPGAGALTAGVVDVAHAGVTFALSAPVGAARYSVSDGAIPVGMSLNNSTGVLSGIPTEEESAAFSIRGTDQFGNTVENAYTLEVAAA